MPVNSIYIKHPEIVKFPGTELSTDIAAGVTSASVLNNVDFASNDLVLIGKYGQEEAEIVTCSGITGDTTISFTTTQFAHPEGTLLTEIDFDRIVFQRNTAETGTFTTVATISIPVDEAQTRYADNTTISNAWYKYRYYSDTYTNATSVDAFQIEYKENSLYELKQIIRLISGNEEESEENLTRLINWNQRKISSAYNFGFMETSTKSSATANMWTMSIPSDCKMIKKVRIIKGNAYYDPGYLEAPVFDQVSLTTAGITIPDYWTIKGRLIWFSNPFASLGTNNIETHYIKFPSRLDSDNDTTDIPLADVLVNRVAYQLCLASNPDKARSLYNDYKDALLELRSIYGVDQMAEFPQADYGAVLVEQPIEIDTT